jgi:hypothetical protein
VGKAIYLVAFFVALATGFLVAVAFFVGTASFF